MLFSTAQAPPSASRSTSDFSHPLASENYAAETLTGLPTGFVSSLQTFTNSRSGFRIDAPCSSSIGVESCGVKPALSTTPPTQQLIFINFSLDTRTFGAYSNNMDGGATPETPTLLLASSARSPIIS